MPLRINIQQSCADASFVPHANPYCSSLPHPAPCFHKKFFIRGVGSLLQSCKQPQVETLLEASQQLMDNSLASGTPWCLSFYFYPGDSVSINSSTELPKTMKPKEKPCAVSLVSSCAAVTIGGFRMFCLFLAYTRCAADGNCGQRSAKTQLVHPCSPTVIHVTYRSTSTVNYKII